MKGRQRLFFRVPPLREMENRSSKKDRGEGRQAQTEFRMASFFGALMPVCGVLEL